MQIYSFKPDTISIDSFKIRIPFDLVDIVSLELNSHKYLIDADTSIIDSEFKSKSYRIKEYGITTSYLIQNINLDSDKKEEYVCILLNSKLLKEFYFEGITNLNIRKVYNAILDQKVISLSFENFTEGIVTDCDFKMDFIEKDFSNVIKVLKANTILTSDANKGARTYNQLNNKGIQWSDRKKGTPSNPYLKIYHKGIELMFNSIEFFDEYIKDRKHIELEGQMTPVYEYSDYDILNNLCRVEFTVKNKKHFTQLGFFKYEEGKDEVNKHTLSISGANTLGYLLNLPQSFLFTVLKKVTNRHIERRFEQTERVPNDLTPTQQMLLELIKIGLNVTNYEKIKNLTLDKIDNPKTKRRNGDTLDNLYNEFILSQIQDEKGIWRDRADMKKSKLRAKAEGANSRERLYEHLGI